MKYIQGIILNIKVVQLSTKKITTKQCFLLIITDRKTNPIWVLLNVKQVREVFKINTSITY